MNKEPLKNISLELATEKDFDTIIEIENKLSSKTYVTLGGKEQLQGIMAKGPIYLIKLENKTVGLIAYYKIEDGSVYIDALAVDPKFQGQGIGREAMNETLKKLNDEQKIWLVTHPENPAIKLYESFGFKITEKNENYFGDGQPRVKMVLVRTHEPKTPN